MALVGKGASRPPPPPPPPKPIILVSHFSPSKFNNAIPSFPSILRLLLHSHRHHQQHQPKANNKPSKPSWKHCSRIKAHNTECNITNEGKNPSTINPSINLSDCKSVAVRLTSSLEHTPTIKLVGQNGIGLVQRLSNSKRIGWCAVLGLSVLQTLIPV